MIPIPATKQLQYLLTSIAIIIDRDSGRACDLGNFDALLIIN